MAQPQSGRPHKLSERDRQVLKREAGKNHQSSVATLTTEFQTASGSNVSTRSVRQKLYEMRNEKHQLEWSKAHRHWTLEQWKDILWIDESRFTI